MACEADGALSRLANRYCDAVNRLDWATFGDCFTEDGTWLVGPPLNFSATGRSEIQRVVAERVSQVTILVQTLGPVVVVETRDGWARGRTTIQEHGIRTKAAGISMHGIYSDEIVRIEGVWRFARRDLQVLMTDYSAKGWANNRDTR